ncbi:hypothetical protein [Enterobacter sp. BIDMC 30]|uniref:helix-turn-helix domain-containing protein n=1 Tax=Enterobacter sp. BIDMC 30 TaxID=1329842 RepID=UPI000452DC72|nr:hypothetical protein [Enterobacter sp. BIDMC 30]EUM09245.1 hypothetical protein L466_01338 [Enterobacter sp. BIDMC 30]
MKISDVLRQTGLSRNSVTLMYKETTSKIELGALDSGQKKTKAAKLPGLKNYQTLNNWMGKNSIFQ